MHPVENLTAFNFLYHEKLIKLIRNVLLTVIQKVVKISKLPSQSTSHRSSDRNEAPVRQDL